MFVATIKIYTYGDSGTELPPPVIATKVFTFLSEPNEDETEFKKRLQTYGMKLRAEAETKPRRPYSERDGVGWGYTVVNERPEDF